MITAWKRAGSLAAVLMLANPGLGVAHEPDDAPYSNSWTNAQIDSGPSNYKWDSSVPAWLKAPMNSVLQGSYADPDFNNSDSIRFAYAAGGSATVLFKPRYDSGVPLECQRENWRGCASGAGSWSWKIWVRDGGYTWCQDPEGSGSCYNVQRLAIHETGHISGFLGHSSESVGASIMTPTPLSGSTGGSTQTFLKCDEARMQMLYDVLDLYGPYADCFDHIQNAGPEGLDTVITATPGAIDVCVGDPATVAGRLKIYDGYYGRRTGTSPNYAWKLDSNQLAGRTVSIKRNGVSYTSATASHVSGNNWTKVFTSGTYGSFDFTAQFVGSTAVTPPLLLAGLDSSNIVSFTITWIPQQLC